MRVWWIVLALCACDEASLEASKDFSDSRFFEGVGDTDPDTDPDTDTDTDTDRDTDTDTTPDPTGSEEIHLGSALPDLMTGMLPVEGAVVDDGFGPRVLSLDRDRHDFHRAIDYDVDIGTPVVAVSDGVVERVKIAGVDGDTTSITVRHNVDPFLWHGETVDVWYAFYSHLSEADVEEDQVVEAGEVIGESGDSGGVAEPHLHFEARIGTRCTLSYSVKHTNSSCARGYDPAVNPLHIVPGRLDTPPKVELVNESPFTIKVSTDNGDLDINRIGTDLGTVDFDLRLGIDATSSKALDDFDFEWLSIEPLHEYEDKKHRVLMLVFEQAPAWIEVTDIFGEGTRTTF